MGRAMPGAPKDQMNVSGPARTPTARTVVWDTAAIPGDEPPAYLVGSGRPSLTNAKHHKG
jgi:hypothetical protein